ncbi:DUF6766 family protein [Fluviicola chungangensis]|uniref:Uncharacterized protein n=1 Tax=Fluviicola chungangensis TaxID=2597671 RepID=A0A556MQC1_9FLAO|nr:hypothetical protein FO442_13335 [Fluviicola chungangensis]
MEKEACNELSGRRNMGFPNAISDQRAFFAGNIRKMGKVSFSRWPYSLSCRFFTIVILSIYLRQAGFPQSKKVNAPHKQTGE